MGLRPFHLVSVESHDLQDTPCTWYSTHMSSHDDVQSAVLAIPHRRRRERVRLADYGMGLV